MTEESMPMTSHRPYLLRALYEWIADNGMTPHLLVDATRSGVQVPLQAVKDGQIVLNVADRAVSGLDMSNERIRFSARFGGVSQAVSVPIGAVLAIYARETGQGMALPEEAGEAGDGESGIMRADDRPSTRPTLSAVPRDPGSQDEDGGPDDGPDDDGGPGPRRGGHLRVVK